MTSNETSNELIDTLKEKKFLNKNLLFTVVPQAPWMMRWRYWRNAH